MKTSTSIKFILSIFTLQLFHFAIFAQTAGSGTLSTIESLARKEKENSEKVGDLNRKHMDTYVSEDIKSKRLQEELEDLKEKKRKNEEDVKERLEAKLDEIENSSSWKNRRESAQRGYKEYNPGTCSAGGPPPICVADHWYKVSYDEAMREYNALVEKELDKIRKDAGKYDKSLNDKENEIFDFQDGTNEFSELRDKINEDMNKLIAENSDIRQRIVELSKIYVSQIEKQSETIQNNDIKPVMNEIANKHFTILRIGVLEAKITELNNEEEKAIEDLNKKLTKQNDQKIEKLNNTITLRSNEINTLQIKQNTEINRLTGELSKLKREKRDIEEKLKKKDELEEDEETKLTFRLGELTSLIKQTDNQVDDTKKDFKTKKYNLENEISKLRDDIWNLTVNLPSVIREAEENLKEAYATKREILNDAIAGRKAKLDGINDGIYQKREEFRNKVQNYETTIERERVRLMNACKESGCSCWGSDVVSRVWQNANKLISCSHEMESSTVFYTGCEEAFSYYNSIYNSLMQGISDQDLGKLKRLNPQYKYEKILNKFN